MRQSSFPRSGVLVLGLNSIQSLLPSTLISQAESLLEGHRIEDAVGLADQQRKKIEGKITVDDDEVMVFTVQQAFSSDTIQVEELHYVYQRIGFQCLSETLFEDAGNHLFSGNIDPRALISYFPDLRGLMFGASDTLDIHTGVAEHMPREASIDDMSECYQCHILFFSLSLFNFFNFSLSTRPLSYPNSTSHVPRCRRRN